MHEMSVMGDERDDKEDECAKRLTLFGREFILPRSRIARICVGGLLIIGGILGFLPVLGFWMIPLGILVLSQDIALVRRFRRKIGVRYRRWRESRNKRSK